jgi:tripartite-type tricarboxylate transporter receptor subunit TctC
LSGNSIVNPRQRLGLLLLSLAVMMPAWAQNFPSKPIRLLVPFPAGGATDILSRALAQKLSEKLGQAVVVENRPGAGGTIGAEAGAKAVPDGYTLLLTTSSTHSIGPALNPKIPYNVETDFTPIVYVASAPNVVLVPNSSPARTLREFLDYARQNPGRLNYASSGNGTIIHLSTEYFKAESGTFMVHIPYRGTGLAMPDLISGKLDLLIDSLVTGLPHVRDGKLRALAVTSLKPTALAPGLPAVSELLPGFQSITWFGIYGPKGLPQDITIKLNAAVNAALADADLKARFARLGADAMGGTPQDFALMVKAETAQWKKIITDRKITTE